MIWKGLVGTSGLCLIGVLPVVLFMGKLVLYPKCTLAVIALVSYHTFGEIGHFERAGGWGMIGFIVIGAHS